MLLTHLVCGHPPIRISRSQERELPGDNARGQATPPAGRWSQISAGYLSTAALSVSEEVWECGESARQPL